MEHLLVPTQAQTLIPGERVLVIAPHPDDEVFGCGGAILRHVDAGARVHVRIWTSGGFGPEPGHRAEYIALRRRESLAAAQALGYGEPEFGTAEDRSLRYGEELVQELLALIDQVDADLVYAPSVLEMHPDHRALGMGAVEAVRRRGAGLRLAQYEIGIPLRPNLLLDITDVAARKHAAMQCFTSQLEKQRYDLDVAALNRYRSWSLPAHITAAEAYLVTTGAELQDDPLGIYQSEHVKQAALGLPLDSRDLPLASIIIRSMDRGSLPLALDSVALQTYQNIEVVVINATGRAHRPLPEKCGRFPLRPVEPGRALERAEAANHGLDAARGEFLLFLDDDDLILPHHIARLAAEFRASEAAVAAYAGVIGTDHTGAEIQRFAHAFDPVRLRMGNYIPIHGLMFRRSAVEKGARFDESLKLCEDWDFWLQLLEQGPFRAVTEIGAVYRMHNDHGGSGIWVNVDEARRAVLRILKKWLGRWSDAEVWRLMEYARYRFLYDELDAKRLKNEEDHRQRMLQLESFVAAKNEIIQRQQQTLEEVLRLKDEALADKDRQLAYALEQQQLVLQYALREKDAEIAVKDGVIAGKELVIANHEQHIAALNRGVDEYVKYVKSLEQTLDDQIRALAEREAYLASVLASTSWKMTAPLRRLVGRIKGIPDPQPPPAVSRAPEPHTAAALHTATPAAPQPAVPAVATAQPAPAVTAAELPPEAAEPAPPVLAAQSAGEQSETATVDAPPPEPAPVQAPESSGQDGAQAQSSEPQDTGPASPAQQSSEQDKHIYDYVVPPDSRSAPNFVRELVGPGKRVLEIGCGPGSITRLLKANGSEVTGIEVDPSAIALARAHCAALYQQDLNAEDWPQVLGEFEPFDVVVAADVLEHLYDPWRTLKQMAGLMREDGAIVVSLPHAGHAAMLACLIGNDVAYGPSGLLDRTHIRFFGLRNIEAMFTELNLKIVEVRFVVLEPEQTELAAHWQQLNEFVRAALRLSRHSNIYQVVLKAVSIGQPGTPVSLLNPD